MIQFYVTDTYPTYRVTFYREGILTDTIHNIAKNDLDEVVFGFTDGEKEQIFNPITTTGNDSGNFTYTIGDWHGQKKIEP